MIQIWKYQLDAISNPCRISMPPDAEILCVQVQCNIPVLWAKIQSENKRFIRLFWIFGTGVTIPEHLELEYISTFQLEDGVLVFHVFEQV